MLETVMKIIFSSLTGVIAIIIAKLDYSQQDKRTKKFKAKRNILFFLLIISIFFGIVTTYYEDKAQNKEIGGLRDSISLLNHTVVTVGGKTINKINEEGDSILNAIKLKAKITSDALDELHKTSINAERQIKQNLGKTEYMQKYIEGGNAFPFVDFLVFDKKAGESQKFILITKNEFDLPIYNVHIEGIDFDLLNSKKYTFLLDGKQKEGVSASDIKSSIIFIYDAALINPGGGEVDNDTKYEIKKSKYYIAINTKNKTLVQKTVIDQFEGKFYVAFQIVDMKGRILKEHFYDSQISKAAKSFIKAKLNEIPNKLSYYIKE